MKLRSEILKAMQAKGHTRYWMAMALSRAGVCNKRTVYRFLNGEIDTHSRIIEAMMVEVGLEVRPIRERAPDTYSPEQAQDDAPIEKK